MYLYYRGVKLLRTHSRAVFGGVPFLGIRKATAADPWHKKTAPIAEAVRCLIDLTVIFNIATISIKGKFVNQ